MKSMEGMLSGGEARLVGLDMARGLAICGMVLVNFKLVLGAEVQGWLDWVFRYLVEGRAAALFVVLAGIGIGRMSLKARSHGSIVRGRVRLFRRSALLLAIGLSYSVVWPADILHFYAFYIAICACFLRLSGSLALYAAIASVMLFEVLLVLLPYEEGWNFLTLEYLDFWTLEGMVRHILFNGFHPVFPWLGFALFGMWIGCKDLSDTCFVSKLQWLGCSVWGVATGISIGAMSFQSVDLNWLEAIEYEAVWGASPMPPVSLYMLSAGGLACFAVATCLRLAERYKSGYVVEILGRFGKISLTVYIAHVLLGIGALEAMGLLGNGTALQAFIAADIFCGASLLFAWWWLGKFRHGPLEWLLRKLS